MTDSRISFPKRAVITAGMPYGNKALHFGHIAGVFVPADFLARFLRDRIGEENVQFISGTDCYGSPIVEGARKAHGEKTPEALSAYVTKNHEAQKEALAQFGISLNYFGGSAIEPAQAVHQALTDDILRRLFELDWLEKRTTLQFYDDEAETFLNGRQVLGRCPVRGCKSEHAYADECDMGHQFDPKELIAPVSQLSESTPTLKEVTNWYFSLDRFMAYLEKTAKQWESSPQVRPIVTKTMQESLVAPKLFIKCELESDYQNVAGELPCHTFIEPVGQQQSFSLSFESWRERDVAEELLEAHGIRFRAGKCLLPLRLTGNIDWGVSASALPDAEDLTVWVWPESLWAPISFTICSLTQPDIINKTGDRLYEATPAENSWRAWWSDSKAQVFQFIGQDNIYFYCLAQPALFKALAWDLTLDTPVANYHVLFLDKKASSSGEVRPPMAHELLDYYTPEQLRCHWLSLGLDSKAVSFSPKPLNTAPSATDKKTGKVTLVKDDPRVADPVLKESAFLTNIFNRLARSCFYGAQKACDTMLPTAAASQKALASARQARTQFEQAMYELNFHTALAHAEAFGREANKAWDSASKAAGADSAAFVQALADAFCALRTLTLLMHSATPGPTEAIADQLNISHETFFSWKHADKTLAELVELDGGDPSHHTLKTLPPKTDFFKKHPSQY